MKTVAELYANPEGEWQRLFRDAYHTLEFHVNMHYIRRYFPPKAKVLDAGGGPGRYTLELCRLGYEVVLLDIASGCIDFAKSQFASEPKPLRRRLTECVVGDVRDLSRFETDHFDAVLCLDAPSYLWWPEDRVKAVSELVRVVKPKGIVCLSGRGYLAVIRHMLLHFRHELFDSGFEQLIKAGNNMTGGVLVHYFRADEIRRLAESCGLTTLEMAGCEGVSSGLPEATNLLGEDDEKWQQWVDVVLETSAEPAVVDMAQHMLYVGRV